jgi:serine protease Do
MQMINKKRISKSIVALIVIGFLLGFSPAIVGAGQSADVVMVPNNFSQLAKAAKPSVVNISTVTTVKDAGRVYKHFFGSPFGDKKNPFEEFFGPFMQEAPRDYKQRSLGSGFIIDKEGYIVTNNHVVENADQIKVKLVNEEEYDATVVGRDPKTDLALIKISSASELTPIQMGDSDKLDVGAWVVAIGSPFGLEQTVTAGIVSAKGRIIGFGPYEDFIQTDASINPGNSGGPLINLAGEVVGINTAIVASGQGIGFAIPVNLAKGIIDQLKSSGEVTRGWLGVGIQDLTQELKKYYGIDNDGGVLVTQIFEGDPAQKAGIQLNDIIIAVDGETVSSVRELSGIIANTRVGKRTAVTFLREGKKKTVYVELAKRQDDKLQAQKEAETNNDIGMQLMDLTPEKAAQFGYEEGETGVLVVNIEPNSKAADAGIQRGDLIKEINHEKITSVKEYGKTIKNIDPGESINLLVKRPRVGFVVVEIKK